MKLVWAMGLLLMSLSLDASSLGGPKAGDFPPLLSATALL